MTLPEIITKTIEETFEKMFEPTLEKLLKKYIKPEYINQSTDYILTEPTTEPANIDIHINNIKTAALNKMSYTFEDIGINVGDTLYFYPQRDSACKEEFYKRNPIPVVVVNTKTTNNNVEIGGITTSVNKFVKDNLIHKGRSTNVRQGIYTENEHKLIQTKLKEMDINPIVSGDRATLLKILKSHNSLYDIAKQKFGNNIVEETEA